MSVDWIDDDVFYIEAVDDGLGTGTRLYTRRGLVAASRTDGDHESLVYRTDEGWAGKIRTDIGDEESAQLRFTSYGSTLEEEYGFDESYTARDFYQEKEDDIVELRGEDHSLIYVGSENRLGSLPTDTGRSMATLMATTVPSAGAGFLGGLALGGPTPVGIGTGFAGLIGGAVAGIWDANRGMDDRRSVSGTLYNLLQGDRIEDTYRLDNESLVDRLNDDKLYDRLLDTFHAGPDTKKQQLVAYQCQFFAGLGGVTASRQTGSYDDAMAFIATMAGYDEDELPDKPSLLDSEDALETVLAEIDDSEAQELAAAYIQQDDIAGLDDVFDEHIENGDDTLVLEV